MCIDTKGPQENSGNIVAYVFPNELKRVLYLLCVGTGTVADKDSDMEYCKEAVLCIVNERK